MRILGVLAILGILYFSFFPFDFNLEQRRSSLEWRSVVTPGDSVDVIVNLVLYFPLGILWANSIPGRRWIAIVVLTLSGALLSLAVEYAQLFLTTRNGSYRDLFFNTAGVFAGACLANLPAARITKVVAAYLPAPRGALLLSCWLVWNTFPFMVSLRRPKLFALAEQATHWDGGLVVFVDCFLAALALYAFLLDDAHHRQRPARWWIATLVAAPAILQFLVVDLGFSAARTTAVLLGVAMGTFLTGPFHAKRWMTLAISLSAWIVFRQFYPFEFSRHASQFGWWPAEAIYSLNVSYYVRLVAGKCFLYAAALAAFRAAGFGLFRTAVLGAFAMATSEFLQRYIPGRTPEITDVLLVPAVALLLRAAGGSERPNSDASPNTPSVYPPR
jgi:VanZ family protein